jgi:ketosteroid isomerase-like protein
MKARSLLGLTLGLAVLGGSPSFAAELSAQDAAAVRKVFDDVVKYIRAGDWASWASQWSEDGVFHRANGPLLKGRAAIQAYGQGFPAIETVSFSNVQVSGEGNLAYGTSGYTLTFKKGGPPPDTGKQLAVFRRSASGKWEAVAVSVNSDLPLPAPPPAAAPKP